MELRGRGSQANPQSMSCRRESVSQSEGGGFCDEFSASHSFGNCIPFRMRIPGCTFHLSCHWESMSHSTARFRVAFSAWAAIGNACLTPRCHGAFFTPAPCTEFDSPRYGGSVDGARPGQDARSASHLYWAGALRGESAYLLRKSAPASAACRRPRPRAKNAYAFSLRPRPAQSSILRGTD